jgi:hypothetical protein
MARSASCCSSSRGQDDHSGSAFIYHQITIPAYKFLFQMISARVNTLETIKPKQSYLIS